jgi:hypothetical protein
VVARSKRTTTEPRASYSRIDEERQVMEMASTKTTTSKRPAPATNGKPAKKVATPRRKKLEEMTDEEIGQLAWATTYKNRHKRLDQ